MMYHHLFRACRLLLLLLFLLLHTPYVSGEEHLFITPTGRQVPLNLIRARIPKQVRHEPPHNHIFDVSSRGILHGPDHFRINLHTLSRVFTITDHRNSPVVSLNGAAANTISDRNLRTIRKSSVDDSVHAIYGGRTTVCYQFRGRNST